MRKHLIGIFKTSFDRIYPVRLLYPIFIINNIRFSQQKKIKKVEMILRARI